MLAQLGRAKSQRWCPHPTDRNFGENPSRGGTRLGFSNFFNMGRESRVGQFLIQSNCPLLWICTAPLSESRKMLNAPTRPNDCRFKGGLSLASPKSGREEEEEEVGVEVVVVMVEEAEKGAGPGRCRRRRRRRRRRRSARARASTRRLMHTHKSLRYTKM